MPNDKQQILAWAKYSLGFASSQDAEIFASNGAMLFASEPRHEPATYKVLVADTIGAVQWLGFTQVGCVFTFEILEAWLTGTVGNNGVAAEFKPLSEPPRTQRGRPIARIAATKYFSPRPAGQPRPKRMQWLRLQNQTVESLAGNGSQVPIPALLRQMTYREYLETEHWHKVRDDALNRAIHRCALCNGAYGLQVHHRTYERLGGELPSDLTVLCDDCHDRFHDRLPKPPAGSPFVS